MRLHDPAQTPPASPQTGTAVTASDDLADRATGRALALSLQPGLDPLLAVADLLDVTASDPRALDAAAARFRACLRDTPDSQWARLALDLCEEALAVGAGAVPA